MGWQRNRNARISGDSSAAREVREKTCSNQVGQKNREKNSKNVFSSHTYQEEARPLHHFLLSSLLSSILGKLIIVSQISRLQIAMGGWAWSGSPIEEDMKT
jgi:hypothetical protein